MLDQYEKTFRGFTYGNFKDYYNHTCSIQQSSLATESCIWLGIDNAEPQIMASDAKRLHLPTNGKSTGWVPFNIPEEVLLSTRMHLTQEMAGELAETLQFFAEHGYLPGETQL